MRPVLSHLFSIRCKNGKGRSVASSLGCFPGMHYSVPRATLTGSPWAISRAHVVHNLSAPPQAEGLLVQSHLGEPRQPRTRLGSAPWQMFSLLLPMPLPWLVRRIWPGVTQHRAGSGRFSWAPRRLGLPLCFSGDFRFCGCCCGPLPTDVFDDSYDHYYDNEESFSSHFGQIPHCGLPAPAALRAIRRTGVHCQWTRQRLHRPCDAFC